MLVDWHCENKTIRSWIECSALHFAERRMGLNGAHKHLMQFPCPVPINRHSSLSKNGVFVLQFVFVAYFVYWSAPFIVTSISSNSISLNAILVNRALLYQLFLFVSFDAHNTFISVCVCCLWTRFVAIAFVTSNSDLIQCTTLKFTHTHR